MAVQLLLGIFFRGVRIIFPMENFTAARISGYMSVLYDCGVNSTWCLTMGSVIPGGGYRSQYVNR